nr:winged helix-turn-helix domain-containing protein [Verrucomicrobium spinosum]
MSVSPKSPPLVPPEGVGNLYERVAGHIQDLIEKGTLRPGERIPSVRRLSEQQGVSVSTVLQAYTLLEDRGVIEARPQSGYYVRVQSWKRRQNPRCPGPPRAPPRSRLASWS